MKASETTLRNLLEGTKQFQIPLFQRPYSWNKENWETLWGDLMSLYHEEVKGSFFLGLIVTQAISGTADGISPFLVVDGQQRLTTLAIILAALRNYLKKVETSIAEEVKEQYLINKFKKNDDFYKILPTQDDREVYKSIITSEKAKDIPKKGQIYEAYKFFEGKLKNHNLDEDISFDYPKLKTILLEKLVLVNITSDDDDNPYLIFESLNNKGKELTQADLVRNYIFMQLPSKEREEVYKNEWLPLQESFKQNMKDKPYADELTNAFWFYLRKHGNNVNQKEVYKNIKKKFENCKKNAPNPISEIKAELKNLIKFAKYYQNLKFYELEQEPRLKDKFKRLIRLDFTTCHIFILNLYDEYKTEKLSLENFEKILNYLESYFVRRLFAGISPKSLGKIFDNLYTEVKNTNPNNLIEGLQQVLQSYDKTKIWPDEEAFRQGIINKSIYSKGENDRIKLFLETIETSLCKEKVDPCNLTIEHIMPQSLDKKKEWQKMLGTDYKIVHKKWIHTLANLTLTAYNSDLSNKPFAEKKTIYKESNIALNKYFQDIDT
jgi:uncharacterized protein with ParB-like and HNH nuclease domain